MSTPNLVPVNTETPAQTPAQAVLSPNAIAVLSTMFGPTMSVNIEFGRLDAFYAAVREIRAFIAAQIQASQGD